jgi:hypothetical protein
MPAKTEKQRKFMGAELARKRSGKKTKTGMSEKKLERWRPRRSEERAHSRAIHRKCLHVSQGRE